MNTPLLFSGLVYYTCKGPKALGESGKKQFDEETDKRVAAEIANYVKETRKEKTVFVSAPETNLYGHHDIRVTEPKPHGILVASGSDENALNWDRGLVTRILSNDGPLSSRDITRADLIIPEEESEDLGRFVQDGYGNTLVQCEFNRHPSFQWFNSQKQLVAQFFGENCLMANPPHIFTKLHSPQVRPSAQIPFSAEDQARLTQAFTQALKTKTPLLIEHYPKAFQTILNSAR